MRRTIHVGFIALLLMLEVCVAHAQEAGSGSGSGASSGDPGIGDPASSQPSTGTVNSEKSSRKARTAHKRRIVFGKRKYR